jgi:ABC-type transport system involved in cytochrome c biogenesis permease component
MFVRKYATAGAKRAGLLMLVLTIVLYVPQFFLAHGAAEHVTAINFVADTLLFSGTMLVIANAIFATQSQPAAMATAP